jgi:hypothetical protein
VQEFSIKPPSEGWPAGVEIEVIFDHEVVTPNFSGECDRAYFRVREQPEN